MTKTVFAAFAVVRVGGLLWATTRDGVDSGKVALPGGKLDSGETPEEAVLRECREEGLALQGSPALLREQVLDGYRIRWYSFPYATPLSDYKEKKRGIKALLLKPSELSPGFGNEFLIQ